MNRIEGNPQLRNGLLRLERHAQAGYFLAMHIRFTSPLIFNQTYDSAWTDRYSEQGYVLRDPMIAWAFTCTGSTRWSEGRIVDTFGIMEDARSFGLEYGVTISTGPTASRSVCSVARSDRELTDTEIVDIEDIVGELHRETEPRFDMTKAQVEALQLIANGQRHAEAANRLGISESALKVRLSAARERLKARTTPEAIQRAKDLNIL